MQICLYNYESGRAMSILYNPWSYRAIEIIFEKIGKYDLGDEEKEPIFIEEFAENSILDLCIKQMKADIGDSFIGESSFNFITRVPQNESLAYKEAFEQRNDIYYSAL